MWEFTGKGQLRYFKDYSEKACPLGEKTKGIMSAGGREMIMETAVEATVQLRESILLSVDCKTSKKIQTITEVANDSLRQLSYCPFSMVQVPVSMKTQLKS
jgi:hypothetical protein